jgi:hypothetical protein
MKGHGAKFPRRMETAIVGLLTQATLEEAAKHAGISTPTLWRWLQEPSFQTEYRKARRQAMGQAAAQLQQVSSVAVKALKEVIQDSGVTASARVTAARTVLEIGLKAIELEELESRVEELERMATRNQGNQLRRSGP